MSKNCCRFPWYISLCPKIILIVTSRYRAAIYKNVHACFFEYVLILSFHHFIQKLQSAEAMMNAELQNSEEWLKLHSVEYMKLTLKDLVDRGKIGKYVEYTGIYLKICLLMSCTLVCIWSYTVIWRFHLITQFLKSYLFIL